MNPIVKAGASPTLPRWLARASLVLIPWILPTGSIGLAAPAPVPSSVGGALHDARIPLENVAIVVQEIGAAQPVVARNADAPMNPASLMKLVTTFAALEALGPAFTWKTEAYVDGELKDDTLAGNLTLKGGGDPKITLESFWLLLRELRQKGIRDIKGDLIIDRSLFANAAYDAGRFDEQPLRAYNVGPDALLLNFKAVRFVLVPDLEGRRVSVRADPPLPGLTLRNTLKLSAGECGDWKANAKAAFVNGSDRAEATFGGTYALACGEQSWTLSLMSHAGYAANLFRSLWQEMGGTLSGQIRDGSLGPASRLFATLTSPQLAEIVRDINKFSNNVMARQLFLTLDAQVNGPPASTERAAAAVKSLLAKRGLAFPELAIENGAGLSRADRISAGHLTQLLQTAFGSAVMPEFASSLPLTAADGTMRKRLLGTVAAGQSHIKTGSLEGVRAQAGYVLDTKGRRWSVVAIVNHPNAGSAQPALDALLQWVASGAGR